MSIWITGTKSGRIYASNPPDKTGMLWEESLCLAYEGYEFLWVYESNEEEKVLGFR